MSAWGKLYYLGSLAEHLPEGGEAVRTAFALYRQGRLYESYVTAKDVDPSTIADPVLRDLFVANRLMLTVKLGHAWPADKDLPDLRDVDARCIYEYARYASFFSNDHSVAWKALWQLLWLAPRSSCPSLVWAALFLIGHLACIGGRVWLGFPIARAIFAMFVRRKAVKDFDFASNIVLTAYPFTLFVSAKMQALDRILTLIQARLPNDPFYASLFQLTSLYAHAYSGNVAQTELFAYSFRRMQEDSQMMRYLAVARIMPLLPLALRGYADLVANPLDELLASHDEAAHDATVNSQVYRVAALIALCLGQKERARSSLSARLRPIANGQNRFKFGQMSKAALRAKRCRIKLSIRPMSIFFTWRKLACRRSWRVHL